MMIKKQLLCLLVILPLAMQAQMKPETTMRSWYIGVQGGVPFGASTFNSIGMDRTSVDYSFGVLAGYRINPIFSTELSASFGQMRLNANRCCIDYRFGVDGNRYLTTVPGLMTYPYADIFSSVTLQQYSLRLNVDMLRVIKPNINTRWSAMLSPAIYGVGTRATIKTVAFRYEILENDKQFQFGAGADVAVGYRVTDRLGVRLSSGVNFVMGDSFDGIPGDDHADNFIWNNNVAVTWSFGAPKELSSRYTQPKIKTPKAPKEPKIAKEPKAPKAPKAPKEPKVKKQDKYKESSQGQKQEVNEQPVVAVPTQSQSSIAPAASTVAAEQPQSQQRQISSSTEEQPKQTQKVVVDGEYVEDCRVVISIPDKSTTFIWYYKANLKATQQVTEWLNKNRDNFLIKIESYNTSGRNATWRQAGHVKSFFILHDNVKESNFKTSLYPNNNGLNEVVVILCKKVN